VRATPTREYFVVSMPEPTMAFDRPVVLVGTDGEHNYGHWLNRSALKFALLERDAIPDTLPLVVHQNLNPFEADLLDILQVPRSRLLEVPRDAVIRCRELVVPVLLRNHPRMRIGIDWLRRKVAAFMEPAERADQLLYVSRRDSRNHAVLNEADIEDALQRRGFRIVTLTGMSFTEQVRTFSSARVIIGAVGAGMTNLMFAPLHAAVLEITNTHLRHMGENRAICQQLGLRYAEVVSADYPAKQTAASPAYYDYYADIDAVVRALDGIMAARP
jgi:capsular polysaccharide biosynthesis protein